MGRNQNSINNMTGHELKWVLSKLKRDCLKNVFYQILLDSESHLRPRLLVFLQPFVTIFSTHGHEKWRHLVEVVMNNNKIKWGSTKVTIFMQRLSLTLIL